MPVPVMAESAANGNGVAAAAAERRQPLKRRKSVKRQQQKHFFDSSSPMERQLRETETWTRCEMNIFPNLPTARERALFVYDILPDDATGLDRLWPVAIMQKDSRDIRQAFELGCLEEELMEFLLAHSVESPPASDVPSSLERTFDTLDDPDVSRPSKLRFVEKLRGQLNEIRVERKGRPSDEDVDRVVNGIRDFVANTNKDEAGCQMTPPSSEPRPALSAPSLSSRNPSFPSFSSKVGVAFDSDKGRLMRVESENIKLGELIMVERPHTLFFCPTKDKISLLKTHCLHCMRYSSAPLPCHECCVVCFCSVECRAAANASYHRYECRMKLYEMLHYMGDEYIDVFMAVRTVTQRPLDYFMERSHLLWRILDLEFPELIIETEAWECDSIESLLRLMGHQKDIDESLLLRNAVIAVFFLRALQTARYFDGWLTRKHPGDRRLQEPEKLILCVLNHVINIQLSNAEPFTRLISSGISGRRDDDVYFQLEVGRQFFEWERIGSCISSSLSLVNHSCDANATRFFMGDQIVLVAIRHIAKGEEITISYDGVHHSTRPLLSRQLHVCRKFFFSCECPACQNDWVVYEDMPDVLLHVPNFEAEAQFKVRIGDKVDLVSAIDQLKLRAENEFRQGLVEAALDSLDQLSILLEGEINKPHQYHVQASQAATLCVKTKYLQDAIDEVRQIDVVTRGIPPRFVNGRIVENNEEEEDDKKVLKRRKSVKKKKKSSETLEDNATKDNHIGDAEKGISTRQSEELPEGAPGSSTAGIRQETIEEVLQEDVCEVEQVVLPVGHEDDAPTRHEAEGSEESNKDQVANESNASSDPQRSERVEEHDKSDSVDIDAVKEDANNNYSPSSLDLEKDQAAESNAKKCSRTHRRDLDSTISIILLEQGEAQLPPVFNDTSSMIHQDQMIIAAEKSNDVTTSVEIQATESGQDSGGSTCLIADEGDDREVVGKPLTDGVIENGVASQNDDVDDGAGKDQSEVHRVPEFTLEREKSPPEEVVSYPNLVSLTSDAGFMESDILKDVCVLEISAHQKSTLDQEVEEGELSSSTNSLVKSWSAEDDAFASAEDSSDDSSEKVLLPQDPPPGDKDVRLGPLEIPDLYAVTPAQARKDFTVQNVLLATAMSMVRNVKCLAIEPPLRGILKKTSCISVVPAEESPTAPPGRKVKIPPPPQTERIPPPPSLEKLPTLPPTIDCFMLQECENLVANSRPKERRAARWL